MIRPGPLSPADAAYLNEQLGEFARLRNQVQSLLGQAPEIFPAAITSGTTGQHGWYEEAFGAGGARTTMIGGRTGTPAVDVARMPDGSTLGATPTSPVKVWLRRIGLAAATGMNHEVIGGGGTSGAVLQVQSGAANSFGYPARVQAWSASAGTWGDASATEVRVEDPDGGGFAAGDYVANALFLGVNNSGVACYSAPPRPTGTLSVHETDEGTGGVSSTSGVWVAHALTGFLNVPAGQYLLTGAVRFTAPTGFGIEAQVDITSSGLTSAVPQSYSASNWGTAASPSQVKLSHTISSYILLGSTADIDLTSTGVNRPLSSETINTDTRLVLWRVN